MSLGLREIGVGIYAILAHPLSNCDRSFANGTGSESSTEVGTVGTGLIQPGT